MTLPCENLPGRNDTSNHLSLVIMWCAVNTTLSVAHPARWVLERAIGVILAEAILPESAHGTRCFRGFAVSEKAVVALGDGKVDKT